MSKLLFITVLCLGLAAVQGQRWVQVWADEFNGPEIDRSKWTFEIGTGVNGWGNWEQQFYTDRRENAFIRDGALVIRAVKENMGGYPYTSARLITKGKYEVKYGKFEMRAKLPDGEGTWPAFWLLGSNIDQVSWPACGEIDIMETVGKDPCNNHGSTHQPGADTTSTYHSNNCFKNDWHTFAANWQPGRVEFFVDGQLYKTTNTAETNGKWIFDQGNMFILLNLAVGGQWPGNPNPNSNWQPQEFIVDWVRVHEIAM